ncbi:Uncharacterised protein [Listeria grayi]|uniref:Uncharacterized protein n=1 Tax=Listeria grayi FSL F6-1183 TaxID=1265827 RepID=A0A829R2A8_LISGR|nr:hypothetical protein [Listeria grayi]EUJ25912.1 hypothetical protein LMUR_14294 [Listeria grayi FSL F6-1183]VEI36031.1 Uncharacterised protein [Listeria grayi]
MKKALYILGLLLIVGTFVSVLGSTASAHSSENGEYDEVLNSIVSEEESIQIIDTSKPVITPRFIPCGMGGKHMMKGNGIGYVWNKDTKKYLLERGQSYRCSKCGLVVVSQNNVFAGAKSLGKYYTGAGAASNITAIIVKGKKTKLHKNTSLARDPFTQGMSFHR